MRCWKDFVIGSGRSFFPGFKGTEWEVQAYRMGSVGKPARCWQHGCDRDLPDLSHSAGLPREPRPQPFPSRGWAWTGRGSALPCPTSTHPALSLDCASTVIPEYQLSGHWGPSNEVLSLSLFGQSGSGSVDLGCVVRREESDERL